MIADHCTGTSNIAIHKVLQFPQCTGLPVRDHEIIDVIIGKTHTTYSKEILTIFSR